MPPRQPWILRAALPAPRMRLFCFAYAGGNAASFLPWQAALGPGVEVCALQLPGRGARMAEAPYTCLASLVRALGAEIARQAALPFAFFGHSLGGLLAFELARYCRQQGVSQPEHLFVSGCDAPQFRAPPAGLHALPDAALIETLRNYNGTPQEILDHQELMDLLLPTIRADFALVENYRYQRGPLLEMPLTVFAGRQDPHVQAGLMHQWQRETASTCELEWFDGDHFFIHQDRQAVLASIAQRLSALALPLPAAAA